MPTQSSLFGTPAQQPSIPPPTSNNLVTVAQNLKELVEIWQGARGDGLDRVLTVRDLLNTQVLDAGEAAAVYTGSGQAVPPAIPPVSSQPAIPPTPENLVAIGGVGTIVLSWDFPFEYTRLAYFEVWRADTDALGSASLVAKPYASVYADDVNVADTWYYWVRAVSDAGVSPFNAVAGTLGETAPAFEDLPAGAEYPAGVYLRDIYIRNASIVDAKIASLSAAKILAGSLSVGQYIQSADYVAGASGYRFQTLPDGTAFMEVNGGARIGGAIILSDSISSTNFTTDVEGWRLNSDGTGQIGGFKVANNYIQSAGYTPGTYGWRLTNLGSFLSKNFNIDALTGDATFGGALSAATGTFAGSLSAATGTFAGALSAATGTFAGSLSAASGTFAGTLTAQVVDTANIVGAAVTSTYASTGFSGSVSVVVSAPAGSSSLVILVDPGTGNAGFDGNPNMTPNWGILKINGTVIKSALGTLMHTIQNPSGSYTIEAGADTNTYNSPPSTISSTSLTVSLAALLTKR